jgi:hypothetical protein
MKSMDVAVPSGGSTNKHSWKNKQLKMEEMKFCNRILEIENSFLISSSLYEINFRDRVVGRSKN